MPLPGPPVDGAGGCRAGASPPPRRGPPAAAEGSAVVAAERAAGPRRRGSRPVARRGQPVDAAVGYRPMAGRRGGSRRGARPPPRRGQPVEAAGSAGAAAEVAPGPGRRRGAGRPPASGYRAVSGYRWARYPDASGHPDTGRYRPTRPSSLKGLTALRPFRPREKEAAVAASFPLRGWSGLEEPPNQTKLRPDLTLIYTQMVTSPEGGGEDTVTGILRCVSAWCHLESIYTD